MSKRPLQPTSDAAAILRERARVLARPDAPPAAVASIELLAFRLARAAYAVETRYVAEVLPLLELTPVPCTPAFVAGVVNVRGRITAVIDCQKFLDLPAEGLTDLHHVILVRAGGMEFGLLADAIAGVRLEPAGSLQPLGPALAGARSECLQGMTADRLVVLDLQRMLADPRLVVHQEVNP